MYGDRKKAWIIDVDKSLPDDDLAREQMEKLAKAARERLAETGAGQAYVQVGPVPDRTFVLLLACYALGPLAPVVLNQDRPARNIVWACLGLAAVPLWAGMLARWGDVAPWVESGRLPFLYWFAGVGLLTTFAFAAWSRSVYLAGWDARFFPERLPRWLSNPVVTFVSGFATPGFGLLLHNAPRRAAWALWSAGVTVMAALTVVHTRLLWKSNAASMSAQLEPRTLEYVLLAAIGLAVLGGLVWVGSALDGARCAVHRSGHRMQGRGEWLVLGVLAALITFAITFRPATVAREFDRASAQMQTAGMDILPFLGSAAATKLDPAQPTYTLRLADVHEGLGNAQTAAALRAELADRWSVYNKALGGEQVTPERADPWVPFTLPSVSLPGAPLSQVRAWTDSLRTTISEAADARAQPDDSSAPPKR